jgi:hypothetical protein
VTLRLHTGGLYLTNYMTSEGNWLHQILFRGFIAKGVNTYANTSFPLFFLYSIFKLVISLHQFELFCVYPLHEIKMVVMQQNRKTAKGLPHAQKDIPCLLFYVFTHLPIGALCAALEMLPGRCGYICVGYR